jgi:hypothetical protein
MTHPEPLHYRGRTVPYITPWTSEVSSPVTLSGLTLRSALDGSGARLIYDEESPADLDRHGILWSRAAHAPGRGTPLFADIHPLRQRRVMLRGLCQVCTIGAGVWMTPAVLWREHTERWGPGAPYPTFDPPLCHSCAHTALRQCPHLVGDGHVLLNAESWANTAIRALVIDAESGEFGGDQSVPLPGSTPDSDPDVLRRCLAKGLITTLFDVRVAPDLGAVPGLGTRRDSRHRPSP